MSAEEAQRPAKNSPGRARLAAIFGAFWMGALWCCPSFVGHGVLQSASTFSTGSPQMHIVALEWAPAMVLGTTIWGVGQGVYLVGDQTLALALIPNPDEVFDGQK